MILAIYFGMVAACILGATAIRMYLAASEEDMRKRLDAMLERSSLLERMPADASPAGDGKQV